MQARPWFESAHIYPVSLLLLPCLALPFPPASRRHCAAYIASASACFIAIAASTMASPDPSPLPALAPEQPVTAPSVAYPTLPLSEVSGSFSLQDVEAKAQHIAQTVMEQANKGLSASGGILTSTSKKAEELAQKAAEVKASLIKSAAASPPSDGCDGGEQSAPAVTTRDMPLEAGTRDGAAPAAENGFPLSILTWCSSICGSDKNRDGSLPVSSLRDMATQATTTFTDAATKMEAAAAATKQQASDVAHKASEAATKAKQQLSDAAASAKQKASELAASAKAQAASVTAKAAAVTTTAAPSAPQPK